MADPRQASLCADARGLRGVHVGWARFRWVGYVTGPKGSRDPATQSTGRAFFTYGGAISSSRTGNGGVGDLVAGGLRCSRGKQGGDAQR